MQILSLETCSEISGGKESDCLGRAVLVVGGFIAGSFAGAIAGNIFHSVIHCWFE